MKAGTRDISKIRKFLKERLQKDATSFYGFEEEFKHIKESLFDSKVSNSALLIAPRGCGKTTASSNSNILEKF